MPDWRRLLERLQRLAGPRPREGVPKEAIRKGYEPSDVNLRAVSLVAAIILVLALLIHGALLLLLYGLAAQQGERLPVPPEASPGSRFPLPALQVSPSEDLVQLREGEDRRLQGYRWVDRSRGIVHIPINRAMELLAERGLPGRPGDAP